MDSSYNAFLGDLITAHQLYPNLRVNSKHGKQFLKGVIDIKDTENIIFCSYLIEIHHAQGYPYRFPVLLEVGNDISCGEEWHKDRNNNCCLTVAPVEILKCKNGYTVSQFIQEWVIPFLANQYHKSITGRYLNEYPHGREGLITFFTELLLTPDQEMWKQYFSYAFGIKRLKNKRNDPCLCGSGKKIKNCHRPIFKVLTQIGETNIKTYFPEL